MRSRPAILATFLAAALAAVTAVPAAADVLVEIGSGDRVTGSFLPASEVERYVLRIPAGSKLTASVAGKKVKGARPVPALTLLDPDGAAVVSPLIVATKTGAAVRGFVVPASGAYTLRLTSSAEGDYTMKVKWTTPATVRQTIDFGMTPVAQVTLHTPPGTTATIQVAAFAGQAGFPAIERITSADGSFDVKFPPPAQPGPALTLKKQRLLGTSPDFTVTMSESVGVGKAFFLAKLVPPKTRSRKVDLSRRTLGSDPLSNFVQGVVIGPDGGSFAAGGFPDDPLTGASVGVPAGALAAASTVVLGPAPDVAPGSDTEPRGPAVHFGPEGTTFADDATITLPFDADAFDSAHTGLEVRVRDDRGRVSTVPPETLTVDDEAGTVSFPTSHFSTYQVFGPRARSRSDLNDDGIDDLVLPAPMAGSFRGTVRVVFGAAALASSDSKDADVAIFGNGGNEQVFGYPTALGDLDGDGLTDLVAASYGFVQGSYFGVARVFKGGAGFSPTEALDADFRITTDASIPAAFGQIAVGDVTGDGLPDLVLGTPGMSSQVIRAGGVVVVPGGPGFASVATDAANVIRLSGTLQDQPIGNALCVADVDGDGVADILVGAPRDQAKQGRPGRVFVVRGGATLQSGTLSAPFADLAGATATGEFGTAIAAADFDGDGRVDVAVGAPGEAPLVAGTAGGVVFVFSGPLPATGATHTYKFGCIPSTGQSPPLGGADFGRSLTVGNVVGDPLRDLVVGCGTTTPSAGPAEAGAYVIVRGSRQFATTEVRLVAGTSDHGHLGCVILPCADVNGDGRLDVIAAATDFLTDLGRVEVLLGPGGTGGVVTVTGGAAEHIGGPSCGP